MMAEQWSGVSPRWFLLLTFFISLSSCGVLVSWPRAQLGGAALSGPRGVRGGLVMLGLQSKQSGVKMRHYHVRCWCVW